MHWFDQLTEPRTRRTMLKASALAGASLLLPKGLMSSALATPTEPCFQPCVQAAGTKFDSTRDIDCKVAFWGEVISIVNPVFGLLPALLKLGEQVHCMSSSELRWHRDREACRGSECGDPAKYPGGAPPRGPKPKCDPTVEIPCGDSCCNAVTECCLCPKDGRYQCCAAGKCASCCGV